MADRTSVRTAVLVATVLAFAWAPCAPAGAQGPLSSVELHGFGGWAYGETDELVYALADPDGRYDNAEFALNVAAHPTDRLSVVAQVFLESGDADGEEEVELDYAFAEWFVSDALKLRVGRVKHPFGNYGEIFDVGTLRPFYLLPQSIYGPNGFTAKAYDGAGITGTWSFGSGWSFQYDLYGGEIEGDFDIPGVLSTAQEFFLEPEVSVGFRVEDTIGARISLVAPVDGLSFGLSTYRGEESVPLVISEPDTRKTHLLHFEYLSNRWTARGEWGSLEHEDQFEEDGGYLELAYKITDQWELAVRGEDWDVEFPNTDLSLLPAIVPQLMEHQDLAFGVSYWFTPGFVLRLNVHQTEGNRFAFLETPQQVQEALVTGRLDDETELIVLGAQFSF